MVQEFHVLRCCECKIFQVHQVKKSNKWNCKVCGIKQSIKQVYGKGASADCRRHVQKLNSRTGVQALDQNVSVIQSLQENSEDIWRNTLDKSVLSSCTSNSSKGSKWSSFLSDENEHSESTADDFSEDQPAIPCRDLCERREPPPKFKCETAVDMTCCLGTSNLQKKKKNRSVTLETAGTHRSPVTSHGQINEARPSTTQLVSNSVCNEKSKWSALSTVNQVQKNINSVIGEKLKWLHYTKASESCDIEKKNSNRKTYLHDASDIQNDKHIKQTENYRGFQFILKASLKSESPGFSPQ